MNMDGSDNVWGSPEKQVPYWEMQIEPDNCSVVAEVMIIRQFGVAIDQKDANFLASLFGWYCSGGGGTACDDIGNLMSKYGISNSLKHGISKKELKSDLINELIAGRGIIVGIRSPQASERYESNLYVAGRVGQTPANHAVVLTGIDVTDPDNPKAIVNDPGYEDGAGKAWPLDDFIDACWNGCRFYVATDEPLPRETMRSSIVGDIRKVYDLLVSGSPMQPPPSSNDRESYMSKAFRNMDSI